MKQDALPAMKSQENHIDTINEDFFFMEEALKEARLAFEEDEVPCGAVVVKDGKIISRGHNTRVHDHLVTSHAEINAITGAEKTFGYQTLEGCTIYVTLVPSPMCAYAIIDSHVSRLVYGAEDSKRGAISKLDIFNKKLGSKAEVCDNILKEESSKLLKDFFKNKR